MKKIGYSVVLALLLTGCQQVSQKRSQYVRDFSQDYKTASLGAPLRIPEGMHIPVPTENTLLPEEIPAPGSVNTPSLIPPGFNIS